jgi:integration host factor subunit beta
MTRSELIIRLAAHFPQLTAKDAQLSVKAILEGMSEALVSGGRIEIRGFGSFALNYRAPRNGRNPTTGETVPPSSTLFACQTHNRGFGPNKNRGLARSGKFLVVTRLA